MTAPADGRPPLSNLRRAWVVAFVLSLATAAICVRLGATPALEPMPRVAWLVLVLLMAVAERVRVHLHIGRETHGFSLAELPTTMGMLLLAPAAVVLARVVGTALMQVGVHSRRPVKLVVNVANGSFEAAVSVLLFHLMLPHVGPDSWATYAGALVAMLAGSAVGIVVVWTIIRIVEGGRTLRDLVRSMAAGLPLAVGTASIGLFVVALWRTRLELVWIAFLPIAILVVTYRAYIGQWRHRNALDFLYDTAVQTQTQPDPQAALLVLVRRAREQLKAEVADLVAVTGQVIDSGSRVLVVAAGPGTLEEVRTTTVQDLSADARRRILSADGPDANATADEVWVRTAGTSSGSLMLRVAGPIGNGAAFDGTDLEVVRSLSRLATTALDRAELAELKAAFLSAVSHELRTPLTVVVGTAATLRARGAVLPPEQQSQLLDRLEDQSHRLERLLSDLLDLDRLNRGVLEPRRHLVDLVPLVDRVLHALDVHSHTVEVLADTLVAEVDPGLTERIVENLVKNAVKYSPAGTTIRVDLRRTGDEIVVSVEDEGTGIPLELRSRILEPFTRVDHDHPQPGTGIGLSLVRRFAQLQGGDAWIEDGRTGGARVVVVLQDVSVPDVESGRLLTT